MTTLLPEGDSLRKAVKWISEQIQEDANQNTLRLVNAAITRFDLSPKDGQFLLKFYSKQK